MSLADLLDHSPAGAWRAAIALRPNAPLLEAGEPASAACAACRQSVCGHSDLEYAGLMPALTFPAGAVDASAPAGAQCPRAPAGPCSDPSFHGAHNG